MCNEGGGSCVGETQQDARHQRQPLNPPCCQRHPTSTMASKHQGPSPIPDGQTTVQSTPKEQSWGRGQSHSTRLSQPARGLTLRPHPQFSFAAEQTGEIPRPQSQIVCQSSSVHSHIPLSALLRPKLGRKERGGKNQDDNQYVLLAELLQFHPFLDTGHRLISQQPRSSRTPHPPFPLQRQDIIHSCLLLWLPYHHARRRRHGLDVRPQRACGVRCRRSRICLGERANKAPRVDLTRRVTEDALRPCRLWPESQHTGW